MIEPKSLGLYSQLRALMLCSYRLSAPARGGDDHCSGVIHRLAANGGNICCDGSLINYCKQRSPAGVFYTMLLTDRFVHSRHALIVSIGSRCLELQVAPSFRCGWVLLHLLIANGNDRYYRLQQNNHVFFIKLLCLQFALSDFETTMNSKRPSPSPTVPSATGCCAPAGWRRAVTYLQHRHHLGDAGAGDRRDLHDQCRRSADLGAQAEWRFRMRPS